MNERYELSIPWWVSIFADNFLSKRKYRTGMAISILFGLFTLVGCFTLEKDIGILILITVLFAASAAWCFAVIRWHDRNDAW